MVDGGATRLSSGSCPILQPPIPTYRAVIRANFQLSNFSLST